MASTFLAVPTSTTISADLNSGSGVVFGTPTPLMGPVSTVGVGIGTVGAVTPGVTFIREGESIYTPAVMTHNIRPGVISNAYYYDAIGDNPLVEYNVNRQMRYKFLDKWLYNDYPEILKMMKVTNGTVRVVSKEEERNNDISKDTADEMQVKSDYIARNILTLNKNRKILMTLMRKHVIKIFDMNTNTYFVKKAQKKYVIKKLKELRDGKSD